METILMILVASVIIIRAIVFYAKNPERFKSSMSSALIIIAIVGVLLLAIWLLIKIFA